MIKMKSKSFFILLLLLQIIVFITVFFDVSVARQFIGFFYFSFVPGFIIIKIFKMNKLDGWTVLLFSIGLSIAFLMFTGLIINDIYLIFGFISPLSLMPLMIILNILILTGGVILYLRTEHFNILTRDALVIFPSAFLFLTLPLLNIMGIMMMNVNENNYILLFTIVAIDVLFGLVVISEKLISSKFYVLVILIISISLLYHSSLISNYLVAFGSDNPNEYFVYKITEQNMYWRPEWKSDFYGRYGSMLSITILPTMYSILLNLDATWLFKLYYPLIFSFVPVALYQLWRKNMKEKWAFIGTFLFMAQNTFYTEMLGLNRQMIAEFFFILLLIIILSMDMRSSNSYICYIAFSFALITSHYGMAIIFAFFISILYIYLYATKHPHRNITSTFVVLFLVMMFSWYIYTSNSAVFNSTMSVGENIIEQLDRFFDISSRGETVLRGLGLVTPATIWNSFSRVFAYLTEAFIIIGFISIFTKRINNHYEKEFVILTTTAMALLAALIVVPNLAQSLNMTRFYHILLFFLAPLCVLGAEFTINVAFKKKRKILHSILLLMVLMPYFLFQSGFVYEVKQIQSWSLPLSKYRMSNAFLRLTIGYWDESEVVSAEWMSNNTDEKYSKIYSDAASAGGVLRTYGMFTSIEVLSNTTALSTRAYIYLNKANIVDNIFTNYYFSWNTTSILTGMNQANKVYSNGGSEVYRTGS